MTALDKGAVTGIDVVRLGESQLSCVRLVTGDDPVAIVPLRGSDRITDNLVWGKWICSDQESNVIIACRFIEPRNHVLLRPRIAHINRVAAFRVDSLVSAFNRLGVVNIEHVRDALQKAITCLLMKNIPCNNLIVI